MNAREAAPRSRGAGPAPARFKRAFDISLSILMLVLLSPLLALAALLVFATFGRPLLDRYRCVGFNGRAFDCLRLRTSKNAGPDEPSTLVGAVLAESGVVELPQLVNVLRGEMSFAGPRPLRPDELGSLGEEATSYVKTLPGLTGAWRLSSGDDASQHSARSDLSRLRQGSLRRDLFTLLNLALEPVRAERRG
jgi:exopolysaccharide production protein ExoY